jgi:flavin reductase (DIM6/NTAB) family NADH-FMN oxidoreductase RutF
MAKQKIHYTDHYPAVMKTLTGCGALLGTYDAAGKPNLMTIGWGGIGSIWGIPVWIVLVRPSRYTYQCMEHSQCFSVNVPTAAMRDVAGLCGSRSGRDTDKFAECRLTLQKAQTVLAPLVDECPVVYECQVVHSHDVLPAKLADEIVSGAYMGGDFHRVYYGKILLARAASDASTLLG